MPIQLVVGLGNPGKEYAETRHNVGAWFVNQLAIEADSQFKLENKLFGFVAKAMPTGSIFRLLIPITYMNESGRAVLAVAQFYKIPLENILVVHDELDFVVGRAALKFGGGHGGHNGLRDIARCLGSNQFWRLRLGIGHPGHKSQVSGYVLARPKVDERSLIDDSIIASLRVMPEMLAGDTAQAMKNLNTEG